jgi:uncharacterized protein
MSLEWDERKRQSNLRKHGIDFAVVERLFEGRVVERTDVRHDYSEQRIIAYGEVDGLILTIIYTKRNDALRIISARRARRDERKDYLAQTQNPGS